jgi:hypothetical protein
MTRASLTPGAQMDRRAVGGPEMTQHPKASAPTRLGEVCRGLPDGVIAMRRGCCTKASRKSCSPLAGVGVRAARRDAAATDRPRTMDEVAVFEARP